MRLLLQTDAYIDYRSQFSSKMAFNISHNHLQQTCFALAILGVSLAIIATILRFVAVRLGRRKPGWEDWFAVLATFFFIIYVIPLIYRKFSFLFDYSGFIFKANITISSFVGYERAEHLDRGTSRQNQEGKHVHLISLLAYHDKKKKKIGC